MKNGGMGVFVVFFLVHRGRVCFFIFFNVFSFLCSCISQLTSSLPLCFPQNSIGDAAGRAWRFGGLAEERVFCFSGFSVLFVGRIFVFVRLFFYGAHTRDRHGW